MSAEAEIAVERRLMASGAGQSAAVAGAVPTVDLRDPGAGEAIWKAASTLGFFVVTGHGVPQGVIDAGFAAAEAFFAQDVAAKEAQSPFEPKLNAGYEFLKQVRPSTGTVDQKESLSITARSGVMDGRWPTRPTHFRDAAESLASEAHKLATHLLTLLQPYACPHLAEGTLAGSNTLWGETGQCTLRVLHYPPLSAETQEALAEGIRRGEQHWRAGPHTDWCSLTLLFQRPGEAGLECAPNPQAAAAGSNWLRVDPVEGGVAINVGDMLSRWSDERLFSNLHRVRLPLGTPEASKSRYSIAFFAQADKEVIIESTWRHEAITAGDYILGRVRANYDALPDNCAKKQVSGSEAEVPVLDFSPFASAELPPPGTIYVPTADQLTLATHIRAALLKHGFVYARGLIPEASVRAVLNGGRALFAPTTDRAALVRLTPDTNVGYGGPASESLNARRAPDTKEVFNVRRTSLMGSTMTACSDALVGTPAEFREAAATAWTACTAAAQRTLLAFGLALRLSDPTTFARALVKWDLSTLRFLHYPVAKSAEDGDGDKDDENNAGSMTDHPPTGPNVSDGNSMDTTKAASLPCGEHTDFGALTILLLEPGAAGLEVRRPDGDGWMAASGVEGAVLLNTGAMLARWCNDIVKATPHRVVPTRAERFSVAFFCDPDSEQLIKCLPEMLYQGQEDLPKYPPISAGEYVRQCLNGTMLGQVSDEAAKSLQI